MLMTKELTQEWGCTQDHAKGITIIKVYANLNE